jgi:hypothetical protein
MATRSNTPDLGPMFVDFIFALAAAQVFLNLGDRPNTVSSAGLAHLGLALVVIVLSFLGYHRGTVAKNRTREFQFFNKELLQFTVDVAIVSAYFVLVVYTEGRPQRPGAHGASPSAVAETVILAIVFLLYVVWDIFEVILAKSDSARNDARYHRRLSVAFAPVFVLGALAVCLTNPTSTSSVIAIDVAAVVAVVLYRLLGDHKKSLSAFVGH